MFTPDGGFVDDPMLASVNLADVAIRRDVRFLFRRTVAQVRRSGARVTGVVLADGERIDAPVVVNWSITATTTTPTR